MNSLQIQNILSRDPHAARFFIGVFPSDKIPEIRHFPVTLVLNSDPHGQEGSHWLAVYIPDRKTLEFFDSYGFPPQTYGKDFARFIRKFSHVFWNKKTLQSLTSNVCGQFCIYFIVKRCQGFCMKWIVSQLVGKKNDFRMYQFVKKKYNVAMIFKK